MNVVSQPPEDGQDEIRDGTLRPPRIRLEASTHCQLKCPTCETATGELYKTVAKGYLKFENFKGLVDANPWVREIELSNFGEIFLNPYISQIMQYAHEKGVHLRVSNGANLNTVRPHVLEEIVKYGVRHIRCSIDGATQEVYGQYRVRGNLETVLANIRAINEYKRQYGMRYPELTWQFVAFGHNEHELGKAKQMAAELGMDFDVKLNWDETYSPVRDKAGRRSRGQVGRYLAQRIPVGLWRGLHGARLPPALGPAAGQFRRYGLGVLPQQLAGLRGQCLLGRPGGGPEFRADGLCPPDDHRQCAAPRRRAVYRLPHLSQFPQGRPLSRSRLRHIPLTLAVAPSSCIDKGAPSVR